jgi:hypothetical protein
MKKLSFVLIFFLFPTLLKANPLRGHHLGVGLSQYLFMQDLKEQFKNTIGYTIAYEYTLPYLSEYEPGLGLRFEYYTPEKDGFMNENLLFTPELSLLFYNDLFPLGATLGMDVNFWKQSKTYLRKEVYHEDLFFGLALGLFSRTMLPRGHLEYTFTYHMQQLSFKSSFLAIGLQYVWDFNRN